METTILQFEKVKLKNPILIEGLPGIGNVGRVAAGYLVSELKMKHFADLYSPHFLPLVILHPDGTASMLKNEFFYYKGKENDIIVLSGDTQSVNAEGHYEICSKVISFAEELGVEFIITLGGFAEGKEVREPRIIGATNNPALIKKYAKFGVDFGKGHPIGTIVGASGLLLGMSRLHGIDAICLMSQTMGFPMITDPRAADKTLHVLSNILNLKIDLTKLEAIIKEMGERISRAEKIHKQMIEQLAKPKEEVRYIG
ncbi:MAG: proteasome assembly chaperone family protein [Candidatus Aenigmatarchaeota archaeon]